MAVFRLVRHASHGLLGRVLTGRAAGVGLDGRGIAEAAALGERLAGLGIAAVLSSPLERALQTAGAIAERLGLEVAVEPRLIEIDFGEWSGVPFDALRDLAEWRRWNRFRSAARPPGGETMAEAQARIVAAMIDLAAAHGEAGLVLVSHGDVIRGALAYWAGIPLDLFRRIDIAPASISTVALGADGASILGINEQVTLPDRKARDRR